METALPYLLQAGAFGLLTYLILWTTHSGAPKLFSILAGIQAAIVEHTGQIANLKGSVNELKKHLEDHSV
jgi:hypothetical protein